MNSIEFKHVNKSFGETNVLSDLSFSLATGKIYVLLGESGSGKTTALKIMNGLTQANKGEIKILSTNIEALDTIQLRRKMGYVIQSSGLFPHMTVFQNISVVAQRMGWTNEVCQKRAEELLQMVGLPIGFLTKKPSQLSGGEKQRVGIVRALFLRPELILMDEPFAALDPLTRDDLQDEFIHLQKKLNFTAVIVTHDLHEAFKLAHEVLVLNNGNLDQMDKPSRIIADPATEYVKRLVHRFKKNIGVKYD